jgi:hypothetical protein
LGRCHFHVPACTAVFVPALDFLTCRSEMQPTLQDRPCRSHPVVFRISIILFLDTSYPSATLKQSGENWQYRSPSRALHFRSDATMTRCGTHQQNPCLATVRNLPSVGSFGMSSFWSKSHSEASSGHSTAADEIPIPSPLSVPGLVYPRRFWIHAGWLGRLGNC